MHLVDSSPEMGGCVSWISRLPGLSEWARLISWRRSQIGRLESVEFIAETTLTATDVLDYGAELVVVATGSHWSATGFGPPTHGPIGGAGHGHANVLTPEQIMVERKPVPGEDVVVYDCDGYFMGPSIAEKLARDGHSVRLITYRDTVAPYMHFTLESTRMLRLLTGLGVEFVTHHCLTEVGDGVVHGYNTYAPERPLEWNADAVVLVTQRISNDALYHELTADKERLVSAAIEQVFRIGDCVVPRILAEAIFDGHRLGREIDAPNPSTPLPYIRERRVLGIGDRDYDDMLTSTRPRAFQPTSGSR